MYFCKYAKTLAYFPNIDTWYSKSDGYQIMSNRKSNFLNTNSSLNFCSADKISWYLSSYE
jgi:hypothetical protein